MRQREAESNTLSAGEISDGISEANTTLLRDGTYSIPAVVRVGKKYLRVNTFSVKTRKDGTCVFIIGADPT